MSEDTTANLPTAHSFEELVLARLDVIGEHLKKLDERLQSLEARKYDTRPIWEKAVADIERLGSEVQVGLRRVGDKIDTLNKNILEMQADQREIERRLSRLESEGNITLIQ